jgi:protein HOOK3
LRDQVSVDKVALQKELDKMKEDYKEMDMKNKMQMSQINTLLMDKLTTQSEAIGQRDQMLSKERDIGYDLLIL